MASTPTPPTPEAIVTALVVGGSASLSLSDLSRALASPADTLRRPLAELRSVGMVVDWAEAEAVALTPLALSRLRRTLTDDGARLVAADARPAPVRAARRKRETVESDLWPDGEFGLDGFEDGKARPVLALLAEIDQAEQEARRRARSGGRPPGAFLPLPTILLGLGPPWPVPWPAGEGCPCCGGRPLAMTAICLLCHRAGSDGDPLEAEAAARRRHEQEAKLAAKARAERDEPTPAPTTRKGRRAARRAAG